MIWVIGNFILFLWWIAMFIFKKQQRDIAIVQRNYRIMCNATMWMCFSVLLAILALFSVIVQLTPIIMEG